MKITSVAVSIQEEGTGRQFLIEGRWDFFIVQHKSSLQTFVHLLILYFQYQTVFVECLFQTRLVGWQGLMQKSKYLGWYFMLNNKMLISFNVDVAPTSGAAPHLIIFSYSLSLPLESRQRRYMTLASTLAGLKVLGSLSSEITESSTVRTDCVGFQRSHGSSPDCGSSTGGCRIDMQRSPFWKILKEYLVVCVRQLFLLYRRRQLLYCHMPLTECQTFIVMLHLCDHCPKLHCVQYRQQVRT